MFFAKGQAAKSLALLDTATFVGTAIHIYDVVNVVIVKSSVLPDYDSTRPDVAQRREFMKNLVLRDTVKSMLINKGYANNGTTPLPRFELDVNSVRTSQFLVGDLPVHHFTYAMSVTVFIEE